MVYNIGWALFVLYIIFLANLSILKSGVRQGKEKIFRSIFLEKEIKKKIKLRPFLRWNIKV